MANIIQNKLSAVVTQVTQSQSEYQVQFQQQNELIQQRIVNLRQKLSEIDLQMRTQTQTRVQSLKEIEGSLLQQLNQIRLECNGLLQAVEQSNTLQYTNAQNRLQSLQQKLVQEQLDQKEASTQFLSETTQTISALKQRIDIKFTRIEEIQSLFTDSLQKQADNLETLRSENLKQINAFKTQIVQDFQVKKEQLIKVNNQLTEFCKTVENEIEQNIKERSENETELIQQIGIVMERMQGVIGEVAKGLGVR
ncbi:Conserved_hypothetical protein [Hexamita inflata]|uniref:SF-assemblin n=1 Tax=Hexamita inflata TaxID=28002 RepID=A0AA86RG40_9EUKA|nr:Conserved hypothetical protein [Hexamita inflata]